MKATEQRVQFNGTWDVDIDIDPGSVADLPVQYSRAGKTFRPVHARFVFTIPSAKHNDLSCLRLDTGSGHIHGAMSQVRFSGGSIRGQVVRKDGTAGQQPHSQQVYSFSSMDRDRIPDWYLELAAKLLGSLGR